MGVVKIKAPNYVRAVHLTACSWGGGGGGGGGGFHVEPFAPDIRTLPLVRTLRYVPKASLANQRCMREHASLVYAHKTSLAVTVWHITASADMGCGLSQYVLVLRHLC